MSKINISKILSNKHLPGIFAGIGTGGLVLTTFLAVKETPRALKYIEEEKEYEGVDELKPLDIVRVTWRCYIPAAAVGVASITCLICATSVNHRRNAALATAYTLSEATLKEYKNKVVETIGEKKELAVRNSIAQDRVDSDPPSREVAASFDVGMYPCIEYYTGSKFVSNDDLVQKAVNELNQMIHSHDHASVNDLLYILGAPTGQMGNDVGWRIDCLDREMVSFTCHAATTKDGVPCKVIELEPKPEYYYDLNC